MKTNKDYTVDFREYGKITVPAGTRLTHQTALGIDKAYHFVDDMSWIAANYPDLSHKMMLPHDVKHYGINVPVEYVDYELPITTDTQAYYEGQLAKVKTPGLGYPAKIKITHESGSTHWLSLNDESASAIVEFLSNNFTLTLK